MLELKNLTKIFNKNTADQNISLDRLNLIVNDGDFITILGGNGAGKSTLFNAICGSFPVDQGSILLDNQDITNQKEYKRSRLIGRLFQDPLKGTAPSMTIEENLSLACLTILKHKKAKDNHAYFREMLSRLDLGLEDRMKTKVSLLSGGQRQAITLLMSTLVTPKLLLLDEHTAALDPATATKVLTITKEIVAKDKITTLMITHNMKSALELGNRTIMMERGKIMLDIHGEERKALTIAKLLELYSNKSQTEFQNDRVLLSSL